MEALGVEIKNVSATFGIAKDQLLETGFNIASAGVEFENVASILRLSAITATGAGTDTTTAFNGIIAVLKKYGENLNQAGAIAEKFFIANKLGQTTIEDLATALLNLSSSAKPAGVTINEVFAILSTLTGVTGNANQVITQLNGAINALSAPTTEASKKFKELGIEVGQSAIEEKGFVTVAKEVFDAVGGNQEALRKLIPEVEASKLIIALATTQNDKYKESLDEVTNGAGNLEEAVKKMSETTDFRLKVAGQKWENFKVKSGQVLITIAGFLLDFGNVIISTFKIFGKVLDQGVNAIL
jgi:TP901 family phage tail tape measure protein